MRKFVDIHLGYKQGSVTTLFEIRQLGRSGKWYFTFQVLSNKLSIIQIDVNACMQVKIRTGVWAPEAKVTSTCADSFNYCIKHHSHIISTAILKLLPYYFIIVILHFYHNLPGFSLLVLSLIYTRHAAFKSFNFNSSLPFSSLILSDKTLPCFMPQT